MSRNPKAPHARPRPRTTRTALDPHEQRTALEKLIAEQGVKPVEDFDRFLEEIGAAWPEKENVDDFIADIRALRREGSEL